MGFDPNGSEDLGTVDKKLGNFQDSEWIYSRIVETYGQKIEKEIIQWLIVMA